MPIVQNYTLPNAPFAFRSRTVTGALPLIVQCLTTQMPPFTASSLGELWNCQRCGLEPEYKTPWLRGDIIPIQLNLRDLRNNTGYAQGWRDSVNTVFGGWYVQAQILAGDCTTVIYDFVDQFCSDWWVARSNIFGDVQTLFIDTNLMPIGLEVFQVKISLRAATGNTIIETYYSELYELTQCEDTILVEAYEPTQDCLMHDYRVPTQFVHTFANGTNPLGYTPTAYWNAFRYYGEITRIGFRNEVTENDNGIRIKSRRIDVSELRLTKPIPPEFARILAAQTRAETTLIDGERFVNFADFDQGQPNIGRMFLPEIEAQKICDSGCN